MDLSTLVLTAVIVSIVLQIVLLVVVLDMKKKNSKAVAHKPYSHDSRDTRKPRESDNRYANQKRPQQEQRPKPVQAQPAQNADPVERSLRDINLRLKNAERDQEKERKRIKDTITPESQSTQSQPQKRYDNNRPQRERGPRSNQPRRNNNDSQRQNNDNRNAQPHQQREPRVIAPVVEAPAAPEILETIIPQTIIAAPVQQSVFVPPPVVEAITPVVEPVVESADTVESVQHGRKVMVKRRVLNVEEENNNAPAEGTTPAQIKAEEVPAVEAAVSESPSEPIKFGR